MRKDDAGLEDISDLIDVSAWTIREFLKARFSVLIDDKQTPKIRVRFVGPNVRFEPTEVHPDAVHELESNGWTFQYDPVETRHEIVKVMPNKKYDQNQKPEQKTPPISDKPYLRELAVVINRNSIDAKNNTPDFILAEFASNMMDAFGAGAGHKTIFMEWAERYFDHAEKRREEWGSIR